MKFHNLITDCSSQDLVRGRLVKHFIASGQRQRPGGILLRMIGVDEVGRGCLAGPLLVVAAQSTSELPNIIKDSKLLSRRQREKLFPLLVQACEFGEGWVSAREIDRLGLGRCLRLGTQRALIKLRPQIQTEIIIDGKVNYLPRKFKNGRCLIGADALIPVVSAASIYAKVTRDRYMIGLKDRYPQYGFERHVGYGTAAHKKALSSYGVIKNIHRVSFRPLSQVKI